jgi:hypothetical protein
VRLLLGEVALVAGHLGELAPQLVVERVGGAELVEDPDDGDGAVGALVDEVQLEGEALAVDGVVGGRVPVQLVEVVDLAGDGDGPDLGAVELERDVVAVVDERAVGGGVGAVEGVEAGVGDDLLRDDVDGGLLLPLLAQPVLGAQLTPILRPRRAPDRVPVRRPRAAICSAIWPARSSSTENIINC